MARSIQILLASLMLTLVSKAPAEETTVRISGDLNTPVNLSRNNFHLQYTYDSDSLVYKENGLGSGIATGFIDIGGRPFSFFDHAFTEQRYIDDNVYFSQSFTFSFSDSDPNFSTALYTASDQLYRDNMTVGSIRYQATGYDTYYTHALGPNYGGDTSATGSYFIASSTDQVPEPDTWTMLVVGFGIIGLSFRSRLPSLMR